MTLLLLFGPAPPPPAAVRTIVFIEAPSRLSFTSEAAASLAFQETD